MNNNCCSEISSLVFQSAERGCGRSAWPGLFVRVRERAARVKAHTDERTLCLVLAARPEQGNQISSRERQKGRRGGLGFDAVGSPYQKK